MWDVVTRGWENFLARPDGPFSLRFLIHPAIAIAIGVRAGLRDARQGRSPYLWSAVTTPGDRAALLRGGWMDMQVAFVIAVVLDSLYQLAVNRGIYLGELLFTATLLALVPYALVRGPVARLAVLTSSTARATRGRRT
jgi:hypothetical protein